jgi:hypothetical protein
VAEVLSEITSQLRARAQTIVGGLEPLTHMRARRWRLFRHVSFPRRPSTNHSNEPSLGVTRLSEGLADHRSNWVIQTFPVRSASVKTILSRATARRHIPGLGKLSSNDARCAGGRYRTSYPPAFW